MFSTLKARNLHPFTRHDTHWGIFTLGRTEDRNIQAFLSTDYRDNDRKEKPINFLVLAIGTTHALRIALPAFVRPIERKIFSTPSDTDTVAYKGRDHYVEHAHRNYGFAFRSGFFCVKWGEEKTRWGTSDKETTWYFPYPWAEYRLHEEVLSTCDGLVYTPKERGDKPPPTLYRLSNYDGSEIIARAYVNRMVFKRGRGPWSWFSLFFKDRVRHEVVLSFSEEVGAAKSSWKGGLIGIDLDLSPGQTPDERIQQFCLEGHVSRNGKTTMTFHGRLNP